MMPATVTIPTAVPIYNAVGITLIVLILVRIYFAQLYHRREERTAKRAETDAVLRIESAQYESEKEHRRQLEQVLDALPVMLWTALPDGYLDYYNLRWYEYTGTKPHEMEGWGWQSVHDPEVLPLVMERWKDSIATGQPFEMVFPIRSAAGICRPFMTRAIPVKDGEGRVTRWFGTNTQLNQEPLNTGD